MYLQCVDLQCAHQLQCVHHMRQRQFSTRDPNALWHMDSYHEMKPYRVEAKGFVDGHSTANQRNKSWLGILRKQSAQFLRNLFKALQDNGHFTSDFLDKTLIQFCFPTLCR